MKQYAIVLAGFLLSRVFGAAAPALAGHPAEVIAKLGQEGTAVIGPNVPEAARQVRFRLLLDEDFN